VSANELNELHHLQVFWPCLLQSVLYSLVFCYILLTAAVCCFRMLVGLNTLFLQPPEDEGREEKGAGW
jgi:hypothetical protein